MGDLLLTTQVKNTDSFGSSLFYTWSRAGGRSAGVRGASSAHRSFWGDSIEISKSHLLGPEHSFPRMVDSCSKNTVSRI